MVESETSGYLFSGVEATLDNNVIVDESLVFVHDQKVWGVGPRMGLDTTWGNFWGFSFLGNTSFSLLYGRDSFSFKYLDVSGVNLLEHATEVIVYDKFKNPSFRLIPALQMFLGLAWSHHWNSKYAVRLKVGWEAIIYWNSSSQLTDTAITLPSIVDKSIGLQGLTAGFEVSF